MLKTCVPSYWYDKPTEWQRTIAARPRIMLINNGNGPGIANPIIDNLISNRISEAQSVGIKVAAYVFVDYARRDLELIKNDIMRWYGGSLGRPDGIFFDTFPPIAAAGTKDKYGKDNYDYAKLICAWARWFYGGMEALVIANPGTGTQEALLADPALFSHVMDAEHDFGWYMQRKLVDTDTATAYQGRWTMKYDPSRFIHMVHGVSTVTKMRQVLTLAKRLNCANVYATNWTPTPVKPTDPGVWKALPTYWREEVDALRALV